MPRFDPTIYNRDLTTGTPVPNPSGSLRAAPHNYHSQAGVDLARSLVPVMLRGELTNERVTAESDASGIGPEALVDMVRWSADGERWNSAYPRTWR